MSMRSRCVITVGFLVLMALTGLCQAVGSVKQEMWLSSITTTLNDAIAVVRSGTAASTTEMLLNMEYLGSTDPSRAEDISDYVERLTAWVVAPVSGDYTFYISGDDDCGLWLFVQDANELIIDVATTPPLCQVTGASGFHDFTGESERMSEPVYLDAQKAYKMVVIHREGGGYDHVSAAWTLPGDTAINVISGGSITQERKAGSPVPLDTETDIKSGVLSWLPPAKYSSLGDLTYDLVFGADPNLLTNLVDVSDLEATSYDVGAVDGTTLAFNTTYYWRVNVSDPNTGNTPTYAVGDVWSFTTNDGKPFIVTAPDNVYGVLNETAIFTVVADTLDPTATLSYQWAFKTFFGSTWADIEGATDATYTKAGLQPSDRGLYRVTVTDSYDNIITAEARLYMRIGLVNRYSFTDNANDSISGADGVVYNAGYEDAQGTSGDPTKRQLFLNNSSRLSSNNALVPYADLPNGLVSTLGTQATFMAWFTWKETNTGNQWQRVFDFGNSTGGEGVSGTGNNYFMLTTRSDGRTPRFGYKIYDGGEERYLNAPSSLGANTEVCYAITWNEDTGRTEMYYNGALVSAGSLHFTLSSMNDVNNWLGRAQWNDTGLWGSINEFRIYDQALAAGSIAEAYALGPDVLPANPCVNQPTADINNDCVVDLEDLSSLAMEWLDCGLTTCP